MLPEPGPRGAEATLGATASPLGQPSGTGGLALKARPPPPKKIKYHLNLRNKIRAAEPTCASRLPNADKTTKNLISRRIFNLMLSGNQPYEKYCCFFMPAVAGRPCPP